MGNSLEERLQEHSNAFDGLLSLIPAKYYYDEETSNQWQQKRKSKEERQENKRQKLNPENNKNVTAKDVLTEAEKTAKPVVLPGEKFKKHQEMMKRQKEVHEADSDDDVVAPGSEELENSSDEEENADKGDGDEAIIQDSVTIVFDDNGEESVNGEFKKAQIQERQKKQKGKPELSQEEREARERKHKELKAKLQAKIQSMREKRKAPGTKVAGAATSRQQILEERRRKAELKKDLKKKGIEEDDDESSSDDDDDDEEEEESDANQEKPGSNVMFGNIEFMDGERVSSDLTSTRKIGKKKGPANKDIKGHLKILEREKEKVKDMDADARKKLEDKQKWQKALASVQGVKVKDDERLLKKALKRKEAVKRKSEREWKDRIQIVADEKKMKADRREENLRIRKENRGKDRKHQVKQLPSYKRNRGSKKLAGSGAKRAGFEGGIRSKGKGSTGGKSPGKGRGGKK